MLVLKLLFLILTNKLYLKCPLFFGYSMKGINEQVNNNICFQESDRVVTKKEGIELAREFGCLFIECSAKTRVNVQQCFEELVLKVR